MFRSYNIAATALMVALPAAVAFTTSTAPASAETFTYDPGDNVYFTYCYSHPPALRIKPGDTV